MKNLYKKLFLTFFGGVMFVVGFGICPQLISEPSNIAVILGTMIELFVVVPSFYFIIKKFKD